MLNNCIFKETESRTDSPVKETELPAKKKAKSKLKERDATLSTNDSQPLVGRNATSKTSLYKPPTFEELQNLKEAEMLFQSNLLKLQVHRMTYMTVILHYS